MNIKKINLKNISIKTILVVMTIGIWIIVLQNAGIILNVNETNKKIEVLLKK